MTKQLSPLEALQNIVNHLDLDVLLGGDYCQYKRDIKIVSDALKRLEEIDKYNIASSVGKSLEIIKYNLSEDVTSDLPEALEKVCIACLKLAMLELKLGKDQVALKKLKAFEIIKEKRVNVYWFLSCDTLEDYEKGTFAPELTQEEFDLLKEEFK